MDKDAKLKRKMAAILKAAKAEVARLQGEGWEKKDFANSLKKMLDKPEGSHT
jgi:hypothetical protein